MSGECTAPPYPTAKPGVVFVPPLVAWGRGGGEMRVSGVCVCVCVCEGGGRVCMCIFARMLVRMRMCVEREV